MHPRPTLALIVLFLLPAAAAPAQSNLERFNRQLERIERQQTETALSPVPADRRALIEVLPPGVDVVADEAHAFGAVDAACRRLVGQPSFEGAAGVVGEVVDGVAAEDDIAVLVVENPA